MLDNVQTISDTFLLSNVTEIVGSDKPFSDDIEALNAVGTQM